MTISLSASVENYFPKSKMTRFIPLAGMVHWCIYPCTKLQGTVQQLIREYHELAPCNIERLDAKALACTLDSNQNTI